MTFTPPASADVHSPLWMALQAWYKATVDEEQAVSTTIEGPLNWKA